MHEKSSEKSAQPENSTQKKSIMYVKRTTLFLLSSTVCFFGLKKIYPKMNKTSAKSLYVTLLILSAGYFIYKNRDYFKYCLEKNKLDKISKHSCELNKRISTYLTERKTEWLEKSNLLEFFEEKFNQLSDAYEICDGGSPLYGAHGRELDNAVRQSFAPESSDVIKSCFVTAVKKESPDFDLNLQKTICLRVPGYFGHFVGKTEEFIKTQFKSLGLKDPKEILLSDSEMICVGGIVDIFDEAAKKRVGKMISIHSYGINFEREETADFQRFVNLTTKKLKKETIQELYQKILDMRRASLYAVAKIMDGMSPEDRKEGIELHCSPMGLGCFISSLDKEDKRTMATLYAKALLSALNEIKEKKCNITIQFNIREKKGCIRESFNKIAEQSNGSITVPEEGNLFSGENTVYPVTIQGYIRNTDGKIIAKENSWDNVSLIGNGMFRDSSVDGYYVAGTKPNEKWKNNSFIFNIPLLFGGLLAPDKQHLIERRLEPRIKENFKLIEA